MNWVVIAETAKDSLDPKHKGLPSDYPTLCREYDNIDIAKANHPGKVIMSMAEYRGYSWGLNLLYTHLEAQPKPAWWKFWSK